VRSLPHRQQKENKDIPDSIPLFFHFEGSSLIFSTKDIRHFCTGLKIGFTSGPFLNSFQFLRQFRNKRKADSRFALEFYLLLRSQALGRRSCIIIVTVRGTDFGFHVGENSKQGGCGLLLSQRG
jgi:hypothetical protein